MATSEATRRKFDLVVRANLDDAYALAKWLVGNGADAEDIVQDAALRALGALEATSVDTPRAWFLAIVRNCALTFARKNRSAKLTFVEDLEQLDGLQAELSDPNADIEAALIASQQARQVQDAIAALPSPLRETLVLRDVSDMSYREIAIATAAPIGTVMSRLARARASLAKTLGARQ